MSSASTGFGRSISSTNEPEKLNLVPLDKQSKAGSKEQLKKPVRPSLFLSDSTSGVGSKSSVGKGLPRGHSAQPGVVNTELFTVKQKLRWHLHRHKGFLNMTLCICVLGVLASVIIVSFVFITTLFPAVNLPLLVERCRESACSFTLTETIPLAIPSDGFGPQFLPTYKAWSQLVDKASGGSNSTSDTDTKLPITIASQYWSMLSEDIPGGPWPTSNDGVDIFNRLKEYASSGGEVTVVDSGNMNTSESDLKLLSDAGANTYFLKVAQFIGNGILHTKSWLVGSDAFYVGSANMDWRSLTEVKEMGIVIDSCPCLAADISRIHTVYVGLASGHLSLENIPKMASLQALSNNTNRMVITTADNQRLAVYISSSPPQFSGRYRTSDVDAIVELIITARHSVSIEVMDYAPAIVFQHPRLFWSVIDDAIRRAAYQGGHTMTVRLLIGHWRHTAKDQKDFLRSLEVFDPRRVSIRLFEVPGWNSSDPSIPEYSRVNHAKFLVTESSAWIGTSNWSGDYFVSTAGIGVVIRSGDDNYNATTPKIVTDLQAAFDRDWNSPYAVAMTFNETDNIST